MEAMKSRITILLSCFIVVSCSQQASLSEQTSAPPVPAEPSNTPPVTNEHVDETAPNAEVVDMVRSLQIPNITETSCKFRKGRIVPVTDEETECNPGETLFGKLADEPTPSICCIP
jgi:PBP1b-binding outer membrane lipoprotein LpoB